jgi:hypothetical protein
LSISPPFWTGSGIFLNKHSARLHKHDVLEHKIHNLKNETCTSKNVFWPISRTPYKMAEKSAILDVINMILGTLMDNVTVIVNLNFEVDPSANVFFRIFFTIF